LLPVTALPGGSGQAVACVAQGRDLNTVAATAMPEDVTALGTLLRNVRATLRAVRAGTAGGDLAGTLDSLAESAAATMTDLGFAEAERAGREAEERAAQSPRRPARSRVPRPRHGLRCVPDEPGASRLEALSAAVAVAAMVLIAVPVPHHHAAASPAPAASAVTASRPVPPVRALDLAKSAARTGPGRDRL
jgi:hypothetical protein